MAENVTSAVVGSHAVAIADEGAVLDEDEVLGAEDQGPVPIRVPVPIDDHAVPEIVDFGSKDVNELGAGDDAARVRTPYVDTG